MKSVPVLFLLGMFGFQLFSAEIPALELNPSAMMPADILANTNGMYGWNFTVNAPITVSGLGWYDEGQDGLFHPHQVGLSWRPGSAGTNAFLVGSVQIPKGTEGTLDTIYRRVDFQAA